MSTKINVRSPYYLSYSEPVDPTPAFTCGFANLENLVIDESGAVSLPTLEYGAIQSYTSTASDFANGTFDDVSTTTSRTVDFTIIAPAGFSNEGAAIVCSLTVDQPAKPVSCPAVVSNTGTIPNQSLNTGGDSVTVDYSSYFTGTTSDFNDIVLNSNGAFLDTSIDITNKEVTLTSKNTAGSFTIQIERIDNVTGCNAKQTITTTISSLAAFDCTIANLIGGAVAPDGSLTTPSSLGTITATKETSGGASVTSIAANNGSVNISVTLFYDVLVPSGYTNAAATIECSVTYTQKSNITLFDFACVDVDLDDQAILTDGSVVAGVAKWHGAPLGKSDPEYYLTIDSFTPTTFPTVTTTVKRTVTFTIQTPAAGYLNSGSAIDCTASISQPAQPAAVVDPCALKVQTWYVGVRTNDVYTNFNEKNIQYCIYKVKAEDVQAPSGAWEGKQLCYNGSIVEIPKGNHTYIRSTKGSVLKAINGTFEYVLVYGSNNIISAVYLKDWNTKQLKRL